MGKSQSISAIPGETGTTSEIPATPAAEHTIEVTHTIKRLDMQVLWDATLGAFSLEKGFGFTLWQFLRSPRATFEAYLGPDRLKFGNPLKIVLVLTAAATFVNYQFDMFGVFPTTDPDSTDPTAAATATAGEFFKKNYNLILLCTLPLMALVTRVLYWKRAYNIVEHLALNAFIFAVTTVWYLGTLPISVLWGPFMLLSGVATLGYQTWVYRRVLGPGWGRAIASAILITVVYLVLISITTTVVMMIEKSS